MEKSPLDNRTILIVDDYIVNVELLKIFVKDTGANALSASNGIECLEIIKKNKVDMILMDLNMPVMNGLETSKAIREMVQFKDIVIIGVIGYEDKAEIDSCIKAGMNDAVPKFTFSPGKLIEFANTYLIARKDASLDFNKSEVAETYAGVSISLDNSIMDFDRALKEFDSDKELLMNLLKEFDGILEEQLLTINNSFQSGNFKQIEIEAHSIKGGAANICAQMLFVAAKELEFSCKKSLSKDLISEKINGLIEQKRAYSEFIGKVFIPQ